MSNQNGLFDLKIAKNESYVTLNLVGRALAENVAELRAALPGLLEPQPLDVIVNCEHLTEISQQWIRMLMQLHQKLKPARKQMRLIYVREAIQRILHQEGVDNSLRVQANLHAALADIGLKSPKVLDVNFVNPFLIATVKVLETQTSTVAKAGHPYRRAATDSYLGDVSGVIGLISDGFSGSVVITFPAQTFLKIMSRMLGEEFTEISKDLEDGAGELTNIIFGQAKVLLNEQGFGIKTAIPSVISGRDHTVLSMSSGPRVAVPFETDVGAFFIEICVSA